jgi:hypothetical protein
MVPLVQSPPGHGEAGTGARPGPGDRRSQCAYGIAEQAALFQRPSVRVFLAEMATANPGQLLQRERGIVGFFRRGEVIDGLAVAHDRPEILLVSNDVETLHDTSPITEPS